MLGCAALPSSLSLGAVVRLQMLPETAPSARAPVGPRLGIPLPVPPLVLGIGAVLAGLLIFGPGTLQTKLDILGFGICHQLLSHSFIIGGHPLPVCRALHRDLPGGRADLAVADHLAPPCRRGCPHPPCCPSWC